MSEKRPVSLLLFDIFESIEKIEKYTRDMTFDQLMEDERTKDAIVRNIQIIGEASKHIPENLVTTHPEVDWKGIAGVRDIVTHRYFRIDWHLLWTSIREELPPLKGQIKSLLEKYPK
ncbi:DUF86 domain-containing protein [Methanoregula sp.]|jgi:hypothetical protein|uniref:HepT-like ribonuclease domain-containing protein n=1 Tax=Methanoregula sp. TaxID=2052170 RepID=UPI00356331DA